jgi:hypothetical protein
MKSGLHLSKRRSCFTVTVVTQNYGSNKHTVSNSMEQNPS